MKRGPNFKVLLYVAATGTAEAERVYGFRLCLDGRTGKQTFYILLLGGEEKLHRKKISIHNDMYIFAKLYKVALIVNSSGNHDNALTLQEVLPCGWAGGGGIKKERKKYST